MRARTSARRCRPTAGAEETDHERPVVVRFADHIPALVALVAIPRGVVSAPARAGAVLAISAFKVLAGFTLVFIPGPTR